MDNPYEAVLEDVMERIVEERGTEILALDWAIMDQLHEAGNALTLKHDTAISNAMERKKKLSDIITGKVALDDPGHKTLTIGAVKRRFRAEQRLIKRNRRGRSKANKRGFITVNKPHGLRGRLDGVGLAQDKEGQFFVHTHRARCKSYSSPDKIPLDKIRFIKSTG